ncbi:hypothetical protein BD309DRAFT_545027 [Dichomitus squalens]|uniref:Uncharacterized protein n=1 Tax=Dichomitus squalens TaxID=114155 RepID=A0A4Q9NFK5_9APHY|nr:hypothetical protein BD311DRAFT_426308 [Dichomitus squalens]TBU38231.1 hypothetical protein BD309DRAFT_545027 [Dichomitus squalens]
MIQARTVFILRVSVLLFASRVWGLRVPRGRACRLAARRTSRRRSSDLHRRMSYMAHPPLLRVASLAMDIPCPFAPVPIVASAAPQRYTSSAHQYSELTRFRALPMPAARSPCFVISACRCFRPAATRTWCGCSNLVIRTYERCPRIGCFMAASRL